MIRTVERLRGFANIDRLYRTKAGIHYKALDILVPRHHNVVAVLQRPHEKLLIPAHNIVTLAGDVFYAENIGKGIRGSGASTNAFNRHAMCSARTSAWAKTGSASQYGNGTVIAGSSQANDASYPLTADADTDNTGAGADILTHRVSYTAAAFNGTIVAGMFHDSAQTVAGSPLLSGYDFTSFAKANTDTLKVFLNHDVTGS